MIQCPECDRHHRPTEPDCPFCRAPRPFRTAMSVLGGAVTTVVLAACYGPPGMRDTDWHPDTDPPTDTDAPTDTDTPADADRDGYGADVDCDDTDATVNPGATEVCGDGIDNDCDGQVDEDCPT